jgi:hypothetical protein
MQAAAWQAHNTPGHVNRLDFDGVLTRIGKPSDAPPNGSNGKRVLLTAEAAQRALRSLHGMGVNLTDSLAGHAVAAKVGCIESARIEGDAIRISGTIWAGDFPTAAARMALRQADLGFSFEAQRVKVEDATADPLVIPDCIFTGAAVPLKDQAAYRDTLLSIAAARQKESMMGDMKLAAGAQRLPERLQAAAQRSPEVRRVLKIMAGAGVERLADVDRLSETQLNRVLENRTPGERIELKTKLDAMGVYPRELLIFAAVPMPS